MNNTAKFYAFRDFAELKDEELIDIIKTGNEEALNYLILRYKELINMKVSKYFIIGAERDDIVQEGMIGLYKAIKSYDGKKQNSFKTFANLCIERQLITAIKTSNRQKHIPLNSYLSLNNNSNNDEDEKNLLELLMNSGEDPLEEITKKEYYNNVANAIDKSLSKFEKQVLNRFIKGESYVQIANKLEAPVKSVDNAIQRIRKKAIRDIVNNQ